MVPDDVPLAPDVMVSHAVLLEAVQLQSAVTPIVPLEAPAPTLLACGLIERPQGIVTLTVRVWLNDPATVLNACTMIW
jgi:hypothetical protein